MRLIPVARLRPIHAAFAAVIAALILVSCHGEPASRGAQSAGPKGSCSSNWKVFPEVGGNGSLSGMASDSETNAWAVGSTSVDGVQYPLILHWDGSAWNQSDLTSVAPTNSSLSDVAIVSPNDVWAVGEQTPDHFQENFMLHWNGSAWQNMPVPSVAHRYNNLEAVSFASAKNGWAVGEFGNARESDTLTLHFDGTHWSRVASPAFGYQSFLYGIATPSPRSAWAAGVYYYSQESGFYKGLVLHWKGGIWNLVRTPATTAWGSYDAIAMDSGGLWAVGDSYSRGQGPHGNLISRMSDNSWDRISDLSLTTRNNTMNGVSSVSASSAWAVGHSTDSSDLTHPVDRTLVVRWDGTSWTSVESPNVGGWDNDLESVAAGPDGQTWAVGSRSDKEGTLHTLIMRSCA